MDDRDIEIAHLRATVKELTFYIQRLQDKLVMKTKSTGEKNDKQSRDSSKESQNS